MARRISASQFRSLARQAEQRQRQAINNYNSAVRRHNSDVRRAIAEYNREVATHNARVRTNRQRLQSELGRLQGRSTSPRYTAYRVSVESLHTALRTVTAESWRDGGHLFDLAEGEAANSLSVLNVLEGAKVEGADPDPAFLQGDAIRQELGSFGSDLPDRWVGALFALNPRNPDAARHFCTSAREIISSILESEAPDAAVLEAEPQAPLSDEGRPTRRARIRYCLARRGRDLSSLSDFLDKDIANVIDLFRTFNDGTHGRAGHFDVGELVVVKARVEDAVRFLHAAVKA